MGASDVSCSPWGLCEVPADQVLVVVCRCWLGSVVGVAGPVSCQPSRVGDRKSPWRVGRRGWGAGSAVAGAGFWLRPVRALEIIGGGRFFFSLILGCWCLGASCGVRLASLGPGRVGLGGGAFLGLVGNGCGPLAASAWLLGSRGAGARVFGRLWRFFGLPGVLRRRLPVKL